MQFLLDGQEHAPTTILLAHGAGAAMDSATLAAIASALAGPHIRVARFEFGYMAARREGIRKPPPRAETLMPEYRDAVAALGAPARLVIGGKSMGGRVASLVADELHGAGQVAGLLCLGYPFHPPGKPDQLRTAHLLDMKTPALVCQGTRDPFGTREEVESYALPDTIETVWLEDGDHDFKPRKRISGLTLADHLATLEAAVVAWTRKLA